jgi:hypothetical protein
MRKLLMILGVAALLAPAAALAEEPASDPTAQEKSPAQWCKEERTKLGDALFRLTYGTNIPSRSNAFGKCVSKKAQEGNANQANSAKDCRAEQQDPNFAATHGGKTFDQFYGTGKRGKNAFGKCVASKSSEAAAEQSEATINAAKACKVERASDPVAFKNKYGTNKNKSNAFGKCVSKHAKTA